MIRSKSQSQRNPITITEDDSEENVRMRRCLSMPTTLLDMKGIMKCRTLDESMKREYGAEGTARDKNITFHNIIIREYARTVGDNPSCSSGPPVSISWEYNKVGALPVEDYEKTRPPRRSHFEMVLPRKLRQDMLKREWDVPQRQIADAVRNNVKIKNQRKATVNNLGKATKMEEALESAQRKLKRIITFKKPVSRQVADLEAKMNEANRRRGQMRLELAMAGEYDDSVPMVEEASPATSEEPEPESNIPEPVLPKVESAPAAIQASGEIPEKTPESTQ